jgi:hypothetical protein
MQGVEYARMPSTVSAVPRKSELPPVVATPQASVVRETRRVALIDPVSPALAPKAASKPTRITLS